MLACKQIRLAIVFLFTSLQVLANEGMWLPQLLGQLNEKEMKEMGMKISAKDIYAINSGSLKDAIVSFGGFCTAEVISEEGLILTNHHCGFSAIQSHTSLQNNYLANGFWAMDKSQELPNPTLFATFIIRIDDVSVQALAGVIATMTESERQSQIDKNINALNASVKKETFQDHFVRAFFEGNKYFLFVTETYRDVRLVGAPPSDIGKFGADTDNWMWPRHTGDFSLFRIYAGADNKPAAYAASNKPYKPKRSLTINTKGLKDGDFTMVFGFPGRTQQYLPAAALVQTLEYTNPFKIDIRDKSLKTIDGFMRTNEQVKIQYASKYASTANAWKKWIGEVQGMQFSKAVAKRQDYEKTFQQRVDANADWKNQYGQLLTRLKELYKQINPLAKERDIYTETILQTELLKHGTTINRFLNGMSGRQNPEEEKSKLAAASKTFYKDYSPMVDMEVAKLLWANYLEKMPKSLWPDALAMIDLEDKKAIDAFVENLYATSNLTDAARFEKMMELAPDELMKVVLADPAMQLLGDMQSKYTRQNQGTLNKIQDELNKLQRTYMQAQMDVMKDRKFYPDANSTLRVTYGKVGGSEPRDGIVYKSYTYLDGVLEKYKPGDYEFNVPEKLIELYTKKDYGRYGVNGRMPVNFIAANHTTGGNSGSPALDANGYLVGLNFDRAWEGTMSDLNYDADICRNIMVDIRYILFIIDKFAGAGHLVKEMKMM
jgi:hypothetical protein